MTDATQPATPPSLAERLAALRKQQEQAVGQVNYLAGAIAMLEALIAEQVPAAPDA